jgi:hypothetical protein
VEFEGDGFGSLFGSLKDDWGNECKSDSMFNCALQVPYGTSIVTARPRPGSKATWSESGCAGTDCRVDITSADNPEPSGRIRRRIKVTFELINNVAFRTSRAYRADGFGGLSGADAECASLARDAGLHGTRWVAWIGTANIAPESRLGTTASGWVRTDGMPIAQTVGDLTAGRLQYPIFFDEKRNRDTSAPSGEALAWTGPVDDCGGWTIGANTSYGNVGATFHTSRFWASGEDRKSCDNAFPLYCFAVDTASALPVFERTERPSRQAQESLQRMRSVSVKAVLLALRPYLPHQPWQHRFASHSTPKPLVGQRRMGMSGCFPTTSRTQA